MSDPVFDPDSPFATVEGDKHGRVYFQDGSYFRADQSFWTDAAQAEDDLWMLCRRRNGEGPIELVKMLDAGAFSGAYADLTGTPTLGTVASHAATDFATAAQGAKADAAVPLASATAAQIADKTHAINTAGKTKGKHVYDTTNDLIYFAIGTTDVAKWRLTGAVDSTGDVTPA